MKLVGVIIVASYGLTAATSASAQGPRRGMNTAPRLMVANPVVVTPTDSAIAIEIGNAARQSVQEMVGDDYNVITQQQMGDALQSSGYDSNAILNNTSAFDLARNLQARVLITSVLAKGETNQLTITARLTGINDSVGNIVSATQLPEDRPIDFGYRIAEVLRPLIKSLADAKDCINDRETDLEKASKSAEKALKKIPNHGLAQLCLFLIAEKQGQPVPEQIKYLEAVVKADSLSTYTWRVLANKYNIAGDTAKALLTARRLLRMIPNDMRLRESIIHYLVDAGQHKSALELMDEALKSNPDNTDLLNLKANVCAFLKDFTCTVGVLEMVYSIDPTKADSVFFARILGAASAGETVDTARIIRWGQLGAAKYPDNVALLSQLNQAYVWTGQVDSSLSVTIQILARDTTAVRPALAAVQALVQADRMSDEAVPFINFIKRNGDTEAKNHLAGMVLRVASRRLQADSVTSKPRDLSGGVDLARLASETADSVSRVGYYSYLVLGTGLLQQANELDPQTEQQKSCELAQKEQQLIADAKTALTKAAKSPDIQPKTEPYLKAIEQFGPRITVMLKAYCR